MVLQLHSNEEKGTEDHTEDLEESTTWESISTLESYVPTTNGSIGGAKGSSGTKPAHSQSVCPNIGTKEVARSVVKCQCQGDEILQDGKCQSYKGTLIPVQYDWILTSEVS